MKVSKIGEFALLERLSTLVEEAQPGLGKLMGVTIGIGDDAAAWRGKGGTYLACVDGVVDGVHFDSAFMPWQAVGWKAIAVSLSDIAAMGGVPEYALVTLELPPDIEVEGVEEMYRGLLDLATTMKVVIIGGNITAGPVVSVNTTVIGHIKPGGLAMSRRGACPGDKIGVTGFLGLAALGLQLLGDEGICGLDMQTEELLRSRFLYPEPRVAEGTLLREAGVKAAIDVSDGLLSDLGHLCQASGVSACIEVENLPLHGKVTNLGCRAIEAALNGGEDYELLFTTPEETMKKVRAKLSVPVWEIGRIVEARPERVAVYDINGNPLEVERAGWQHFAQ